MAAPTNTAAAANAATHASIIHPAHFHCSSYTLHIWSRTTPGCGSVHFLNAGRASTSTPESGSTSVFASNPRAAPADAAIPHVQKGGA